jgi:hypothetical protein
MSWMKISPSWSAATWPTKPARPPSAATPATGVRRRTAARLARLAHLRIEPGRSVGVEHLHRAFDQPLLNQEGVVGARDDVDHGVADRKHVEADIGQGGSGFHDLDQGRRALMAGEWLDGKPFLQAPKDVTHEP